MGLKPENVSDTYAHLDNGTGWCLPDYDDGNTNTLEWHLRYRSMELGKSAEYTASERMRAASILSCYRALVDMPLSHSREVLRALKAAVKIRNERKR